MWTYEIHQEPLWALLLVVEVEADALTPEWKRETEWSSRENILFKDFSILSNIFQTVL